MFIILFTIVAKVNTNKFKIAKDKIKIKLIINCNKTTNL